MELGQLLNLEMPCNRGRSGHRGAGGGSHPILARYDSSRVLDSTLSPPPPPPHLIVRGGGGVVEGVRAGKNLEGFTRETRLSTGQSKGQQPILYKKTIALTIGLRPVYF